MRSSLSSTGIFLALLIFVTGCEVEIETIEEEDLDLSVSSLEHYLDTGRSGLFIDGVNKIRSQGPSREVLSFLREIWNASSGNDSARTYDEVVLVEIAATLAEASSNDQFDVEEAGLQSFIRARVDSADPETKWRAIVALSIFDDEDDVAILRESALDSDATIARAAISSLATMCNPDAHQSLRDLEGLLSDESRREFLARTLREYSNLREETRYCR